MNVEPRFKPEPDGWTMKKAVPVVEARSKGWCEAETPDCIGGGEVFHHRMGRRTHRPELLLHLCNPCHLWIHAHPQESMERGWMVSRV